MPLGCAPCALPHTLDCAGGGCSCPRRYTGDDRTGILYEVLNYGTPKAEVVPRHIFMEGNGNTDKGFKTEWAAVKDDELVVASFGKEYANNDGITVKNYNNNWVVVVDKHGRWVVDRA